jgi:hypothetical protein
MLGTLLLGCGLIIINLGIQIWAVNHVLQFLRSRIDDALHGRSFTLLGGTMLFLLLGHILQFATWAGLFVLLGEFTDFDSALYHSAVNFTSLGYGDIVMSTRWRLLGALEAANGVLMFGLTAGLLLSVFNLLLRRRPAVDVLLRDADDEDNR